VASAKSLARRCRGSVGQHTWRKTHLGTVLRFIDSTRAVPTVQLFDALWRVFFHMLQVWEEHDAAEYLRRTYFLSPPLGVLQKLFPFIRSTAWGADDVLFAGHWYGIFGTYPGTGSGSLTLEALHSTWQREIETGTRSSLLDALPAMQALYKKWARALAWDRPRTFSNFPRSTNPLCLTALPCVLPVAARLSSTGSAGRLQISHESLCAPAISLGRTLPGTHIFMCFRLAG